MYDNCIVILNLYREFIISGVKFSLFESGFW